MKKVGLLYAALVLGFGMIAKLEGDQSQSQPVQLTPAERQAAQDELVGWKQHLDEYHQGKRDDKDGVVILKFMLQSYAILGQKDTPQAQSALQEWNALRAKHPEFKKMMTYELHEGQEQRTKMQVEMAAAKAKAVSFVPSA
jgi:hypothetical protein